MSQAVHAHPYHDNDHHPHRPASTDFDYSDPESPPQPQLHHPPVLNDDLELDRSFSYRRGDDAQGLSLPSGLNHKSYAARAGAPPDLAIDTSSHLIRPAPEPFSSRPTTSGRRRSSVDHRSPLQKLEVTLGDLSKEEKRARAEYAEQQSLQRGATRARAQAKSQRSGDPKSGRPQAIYHAYPDDPPISRHIADNTLDRSNTKPRGANYNTLGAWERRYGYDAALSGTAAAQALDAYQAAGKYYADPRAKPTIQSEDKPGQGRMNISDQQSAPREAYAKAPPNSGQTAAAQKHPKAVSFGPAESREPAKEPEGHRFAHFHRHDPASLRRYQRSPGLTEWKSANAASLDAADQDLEVEPVAWWEKGEKDASRRKSSQRRQASTAPPSAYGFSHDGRMEKTSFRPPLMLKCGPLLRYSGISTDSSGRKYWRGSIMIVTDDENSSYSTVPSVKLFKQPMDLARQPPVHYTEGDLNNLVHQQDDDPVAGMPKCSPTGETLYVKPAGMIKSNVDLSRVAGDDGLFEKTALPVNENAVLSRLSTKDGEKMGKYKDVDAFRLHAERGFTFWRFNIQVELTHEQTRIAYRINHGPPTGFWVPARDQSMNVMFHSCNGFSMSVNADEFSGPDPLWRDVLCQHQHRPFHVMLGGGDQIYNDAVMRQTEHFQEWLAIKNPEQKHSAPFTTEMQEELESFYLERYAMWFSQGMFGLANSQIPMVNLWDDHDIIDGFGSYPDHFMRTPVFSGIGGVAFKYYMLFQHQSVPEEDENTDPSWLLGAKTGPYIHERSRSLFMSLGKDMMFLGIDCRTERMRDTILCPESYQTIFDRCHREIIKGETKHLLVLLGVPIAYPRLNFLENILTSRLMDPIKALGRAGMLGGFINKFDGGVEILDDLDDHWTAKHHKHERNWFVQALQQLAAEKSVRITILGGDVHLGAIGRLFSKPKLGIPKDRDHRYMPNVISSAIVNTPPPDVMADVLNGRNKIHHLDTETDEDMVPMFSHDVNGKARNNVHLLPRRNWCSIAEFDGSDPSPDDSTSEQTPRPGLLRRLSLGGNNSSNTVNASQESGAKRLVRRLSGRSSQSAYAAAHRSPSLSQSTQGFDTGAAGELPTRSASLSDAQVTASQPTNLFQRRPSNADERAAAQDNTGRQGQIDLQGGLSITLHCEVDQHDPSGLTTQYSLIVPALLYEGPVNFAPTTVKSGFGRRFTLKRGTGKAAENPSEVTNNGDQEHHYGRNAAIAAGAGGLASYGAHMFGAKDAPVGSNANPPRETWNDEYQDHMDANDIGTYHATRNQEAEPRNLVDMDSTSPPNAKSNGADSTQTSPGLYTKYEHEATAEDVKRNRSLRAGPPAPKNIDQLPASVRNRYSQFEEHRPSSASDEHFDTARNSPEPQGATEAIHDERHLGASEQEQPHTDQTLSPTTSRRLQKSRPAAGGTTQPRPSLARSQSLVQRLRRRFAPSQRHHDAMASAPQQFQQAPHTSWLHDDTQGSFDSAANKARPAMSQARHQNLNGPLTSHSTGQQSPQNERFAGDTARPESGYSNGEWMGIDASPEISEESLGQTARRSRPGKFERLAGVDVLGPHDTMDKYGRLQSGHVSDGAHGSKHHEHQMEVQGQRDETQHWQKSQQPAPQHPQRVRPYSGPGSAKARPDSELLPAPRPTGLGMSERAARQLGYTDGMPSIEQEGSWLQRAQAKAAENMNRRSSDSAAPPARRSSWKRWI